MAAPDLYDGIDPDVQATIREFCGWHIAPSVTETITLDGPGAASLFLPSLHVTAVSSVIVDGVALTDPEWSESGLIRGPFQSRKFRSVQVTFTHGYDEVPRAIRAAATRLADTAIQGLAGANVRLGGVSVNVPDAASPGESSTGDPYVDRVLAPYAIGLRP